MTEHIITHSGTFHADEALAVNLLRKLPRFANAPLTRTRDAATIDSGSIVVDVGGTGGDGVRTEVVHGGCHVVEPGPHLVEAGADRAELVEQLLVAALVDRRRDRHGGVALGQGIDPGGHGPADRVRRGQGPLRPARFRAATAPHKLQNSP